MTLSAFVVVHYWPLNRQWHVVSAPLRRCWAAWQQLKPLFAQMADVLLNSLATALVHGNLQEYCWPMEALEAVHLSQTTGLSLSGRHMKEFTLYAGWQDHVSSKLAVVIAYSRNACMVLLLAQVPPPPPSPNTTHTAIKGFTFAGGRGSLFHR